MRQIVLVILALTISEVTYAQNPAASTLEWKVNSIFDVQTGMMNEDESILTTNPERITWASHDGDINYEAEVNNIKGNWANSNFNGSITFQVTTDDGFDSSVMIERNHSGIVARIFITKEEPVVYELTISSVAWIK